ncbi:MAG: acetyltransferase [Defluviitaleaceae bacterium]|nr:acetyltransferase [Defluviitaleaceae bacterium]
MIDVYLFGKNSLAQILATYITHDKTHILRGFTANKQYCTEDEFLGLPLVPFEDLPTAADSFAIINCMGYSDRLANRVAIFAQISAKKLHLLSYIHPTAVTIGVTLGDGNIILPNAVIEPFSVIGMGNVLYGGVYICHDAAIGDNNWFSAGCVLAGYANVGDRNFFGINSCVKEQTKIGESAIIGAGAVVIRDVADGETVVGNPAKPLVPPNATASEVAL